MPAAYKTSSDSVRHPLNEEYYRDLRRKNLVRLFLTYVAPIILLTIFFHFQYDAMVTESRRLHLRGIARNQTNTLDLFLSERLVNLSNLIDGPRFVVPPTSNDLRGYLEKLQQSSDAFADLDVFDSTGLQTAYAGPMMPAEGRNYSGESWYEHLYSDPGGFVITDIYLGFRQRPHFTMAVSRIIDGQLFILRATISPKKINEYVTSLAGSDEVHTSIVNREGYYQLVPEAIGTLLAESPIIPPDDPEYGLGEVELDGRNVTYAYCWLQAADWALIVQPASRGGRGLLFDFSVQFGLFAVLLVLIITFVIFRRAGRLVRLQEDSDRTRVQLEHAAKLASVGELAAGIAHEINNPLAVISESAGLARDLMNPELGEPASVDQLLPLLDDIHESVFRCRDITRKLLGFVRRTDLDLKPHDIHTLIDGVVDGILGREMEISNVEVVREYDRSIPQLVTDGNQLQQVILNIMNNAVDAIGDNSGRISIVTSHDEKWARVSFTDTGKGMNAAELDSVFVPFFTTKEVGKGTGLGLSVSYSILKSMGGTIEVDSDPGQGSTFTLVIPVR